MRRNRRKSAQSKAEKALQIATRLQNQQEKKFIVTSMSQQVDSTGHIYTLNDVPQDLTDSGRVGDQITNKRVSLNFWRVLPGSASGRFSVRILVIHDKQDTITSLAQVFVGTGGIAAPLLAFVKDQRLQFTVLYDSQANHMDQYNKGDCVKWQRSMNLRSRFAAGGADIVTGSLKLLLISNISANSNTKPLAIGHARVDYTDS
jgi:hypothetical protein